VKASTNIGFLVPETPDQAQVPRVKSSLFQISRDSLTAVDSANPADFLIMYLFLFFYFFWRYHESRLTIYIYDLSLLKKVNVFANLKSLGSLVLQWPYSINELEEKLPSATKREIAGKRLKLFVFEAAENKLASQLAAFCAFSGIAKDISTLKAV
jgi:hypothetical protein